MTSRNFDHSSQAPAHTVPGLRHGYLSLIENLAQTVGVLSPAGTISVIIPLLILSAGNGTWLLLLVTLSIFLLVMFCVTRFASLYSSAGSIAAFGRLGWGARGGLIGAWIYLVGIAYCVPSALLASASYAEVVLGPALGFIARPVRLEIITALLTLGCALAAYRDIKLSTILMLIIECLSVSLMLVLLVSGMWSADAWMDDAQISLRGARFSGLQGGLVLAFMLMAGFEGTTSLGEEAQDPRKTIPKAIVSCMLPLTLVYLLVAYCLVSLENRGVVSTRVDGLTMPFDDIARAIRLPWLGPWSSLGVALSYFACGLGSLIIASRVLFSMARAGEFWPRFGEAHPRNATPHRAIALLSVVSAVIPVVMLARGMDLGVSVNFLSQLGSLGLIGGYFMMVVALPRYLRRRGLLRTRDWALSAAAGLMLIVVLVLSVYPRPAAPYDDLVYVFGGSVLLGVFISSAVPFRRVWASAVVLAFASFCGVRPASGAALAITHIDVIDATGGPLQPDMTVIVREGRIAELGRSDAMRAPPDAKVLDGSGKYLIPGLWDMHVHMVFGDWLPRNENVVLPLFVANGVTGVRDMGGDLEVLKAWRSGVAAGRLLGPRMIIAGPMLDGPVPRFPSSAPVANAADGRRTVDELTRRGVDFIKIQSLIPRDGYFAAAAEARRLGIVFVGHVPDAVRASEASNAGQKSIEHFTGIFEGCSSIEDALIQGPKGLGLNVKTYDPIRANALIALMVKNQTWQVPTLVWERGQWLIDAIDLRHDPLIKYAPASWKERTWPMFVSDIKKDMDTDPLPVREKFVRMELEMTLAMFRAGVPFMAGTDTAAGVHIFPGFSLHQELVLFQRAGLTPMQALQTATLNPAKFMGRTSDLGTVETGKLADLVLLDANPLDDIANTQKIRGVVLAGRYFDRAALDRMLRGVVKAAAAETMSPAKADAMR